ncbi:hypothetical protein BHM03_00011769 [Ensete ventricosum]|nr:hypothetical protein BHM03_00011769 [Ensete ventricosum]
MQPSSREMQGMAGSMNGGISRSSAVAQIALRELQNGHGGQQIPNSVPQASFDHGASGHDDFLDQMLSSLPSSWAELGNLKTPWDPPEAGQRLFSAGLVGESSPEEPSAAAAEGMRYPPYDESSLLANRLRQHQISGGSSPNGKGMMVHLDHQSQQQMLLPSLGRSPVASGDSGLLPLPLTLGTGGYDVDAPFKSLNPTVLSMSRLGGAAAVAPLVADISSEGQGGAGSGGANSSGDSLTVTEHQVAKLMEEDMGSAMQYLQGKGLCLMPISLASAISTATACPPRLPSSSSLSSAGAGHLGHGILPGGLHPPNLTGDAPASPGVSALTAQSAMANGGAEAAKEAVTVSKA